jgi:glutamate 5-kinase
MPGKNSIKRLPKSMPKKRQRWVIKAGSNLVCTGGPLLVRALMQQVAALRRQHGIEVIWVTSGAIASAVDKTGYSKRKRLLSEKQALSAIGQPMVMDLYNLALQNAGRMGAQILLTYDDLADSVRRTNFQNTIEQLLQWEVVPVLNENDAVSTDEIRFGDNDRLSAKVARYVSADRLVILTDVDGLYNKDPKKHRDARPIRKMTGVSDQVLKSVEPGAGSQRGTGGMFSKLKAAQEAGEYGVETWLLRGDLPDSLLRILNQEVLGTLILPPKGSRRS